MKKNLLAFLFTILIGTINAQEGTLKVGDKAPALVLPTTEGSLQSFTFPYQNKIVFINFWSSGVGASKENLYKYSKLGKRYTSVGYKACDGFEVINVAIQSDRNAWQADVAKYGLTSGINNCIALRGYQDYAIKPYKLSQTPSSFLVDETGTIIMVNPHIKTIVNYLDERKNIYTSDIVQDKIAGKIMYGETATKPLVNEKIYFTNDKNDTLQTVMTNETGAFTANNVNTILDIVMNIAPSKTVGESEKVFVTSENGEILSDFKRKETGWFYYKLLNIEMPYLKSLKASTSIKGPSKKELKNLYYSENLFKANGIILTKDINPKLDAIVTKLKQNPKTDLEIITHTDSKGDAKTNEEVSLKRSNAISTYIVSKGIAKKRIKAIGKGETELLNKCKDGEECTPEEHEKNRRTEFKFYPAE